MIAAAGLYQMYTKTIAADFMKAGFPAPDVEQSIAKSFGNQYIFYILSFAMLNTVGCNGFSDAAD